MKVASIIHNSVVDGPGLRTVIFFQGCPYNCKGCHNENQQYPNSSACYNEWLKIKRERKNENVDTWQRLSANQLIQIIEKNGKINGCLTLSGGEPLDQLWKTDSKGNVSYTDDLIIFLKEYRKIMKHNDKIGKIWMYSGNTLDKLLSEDSKDIPAIYRGKIDPKLWAAKNREVLELIDVVVQGPFINTKKCKNIDENDNRHKYMGSTNQEIVDVKKTLKTGNICLMYH